MKRVVVIVVVVAVLAGGGYWAMQRRGAAATKAPVAAPGPVKAGDKVIADAKVVPVKSAALAFPTGGTVAEVLVKEGQRVEAGQVLARLNGSQRAAAVAQAAAQVQRAQLHVGELKAGARPEEIAAARAALESAQAQLDRVRLPATTAELSAAAAEVLRAEADVVRLPSSDPTVAVAKAALATAQARLAQLRKGPRPEDIAVVAAEVRRAQAALDLTVAGARPETVAAAEADAAATRPAVDQAQAALAETELRAPFAGTVATLDLKPGEYVTPGAPVVRLADLSAWQLETDDLTEIKAAQVRDGAAVTVKFDAIPGLELPGKVARVKGMGEKKQGDMTFTAVIDLDRQDERLRWNLTASVSIATR